MDEERSARQEPNSSQPRPDTLYWNWGILWCWVCVMDWLCTVFRNDSVHDILVNRILRPPPQEPPGLGSHSAHRSRPSRKREAGPRATPPIVGRGCRRAWPSQRNVVTTRHSRQGVRALQLGNDTWLVGCQWCTPSRLDSAPTPSCLDNTGRTETPQSSARQS